jgi:hypothetical protein
MEKPLSPLTNRPHGVVHYHAVFLVSGLSSLSRFWKTSEQAASGHGYRFTAPDHQVIKHTHTHQLQGITQVMGNGAIGRAGFRDTRRVARVS